MITPRYGNVSAASKRRCSRQVGTYIGGFVAIFIAAIVAFVTYDLSRRHAAILEANGRRAENLAYILAQHLDRSVNAVEAALAQIGRQWGQEQHDPKEWTAILSTGRAGMPGVASISITDAEGVIRHSTLPHLIGQSRADTFVFRRLRDDASATFIADAPFRSQLRPAEFIIPLGHRLENAERRFGGAIVASMTPHFLQDFYKGIDVGPNGVIRVLHTTGAVVVQQPALGGAIGTPVGEDPVLSAARNGRSAGRTSMIDAGGEARIVGFQLSRVSGLLVTVGFAERDLLAFWQSSAAVNVGVAACLIAVLMVATGLLLRELKARRAVEQRLVQAQKMEAVGQLTGGIAHDFNNLLTVVLGCADQLQQLQPAGTEGRKLAEMVVTASERAAQLIGQLLAFSRRQVLRPVAVDVNTLINGMQDLLRRSLGAEIEIEFAIAQAVADVLVDRAQLETTLLNLAINARDAMPEGGRLTIESANVALDAAYAAQERDVRPGAYVMIAVTDNGIGMPADVLAQAFEPFFTTKERDKGTGLGLSMVYGFVKQSGGHIRIYSEVGHGTTVKIYLPQIQEREPFQQVVAQPGAELRRGSETILVVEDDRLVADLVVSQLRSLGYSIVLAHDGPAAMAELADGSPIDLLLTDVILPAGMGGRELAEWARQRRPDLKVLFTSGYTANSIVHNGRLDPGVRLLQKPYTREDLARTVRQVLDG